MNHTQCYLILFLLTILNCDAAAQNQEYQINDSILSILPKQVSIVGLGDPSHQESTITKIRIDLIKQLIDKRQFRIIALEGNLYELYKAYDQFIQSNDVSHIENAMYHQLNIPELEELYRYVYDRNSKGDSIIITGFDCTFSGNTFVQNAMEELKPINVLSDNEKQDFINQLKAAAITDLRALFRKDKRVKSKILSYSKRILSNHQPITASGYFFEQALKNLVLLYDENNTENSNNLRDLGMASNIAFLRKIYGNEKMILFASSTHLIKCPQVIDSPFFQNNRETLGEQLSKKYTDQYYFIAYSAISGARSNLANKPKKLAPPGEGSLEYKHRNSNSDLVLDKNNSVERLTSCRFLGHSFLHLKIWEVMDALVLVRGVEPAKIKKK